MTKPTETETKAEKAEPQRPAKAPDPITLSSDVLLRIGGTDEAPQLRRAIPTAVHTPDCASLMVFMDGTRDHALPELPGEHARGGPGIRWCSSVARGDGIGQWRPLGGDR